MRQRKGQNAAAAWTPLSLASLLAWWSSDYGLYEDAAGTTPATDDGDVVGQQADRATVGPYNATQGTTGNKPTLQNAAGDLVNGLPAIRGDGLDNYLATTLVPPASGTLAVSFRFKAGNIKYFLGSFKVATSQRCYLSVNGSGQLGGGIGTQNHIATIFDPVALVNDSIYVAALAWDGSNVVLRKNGVPVYGPAAQDGTTNNGLAFYLYAMNSDGMVNPSTLSDLVDIVVCNAALSAADLANLETYMAGRVGVVLP